MCEITLGYAEIYYTLDNANVQQYRVSTVLKEGDWVNKFIEELKTFVYSIKNKFPIFLEFSVFVGVFIDNKSDNVINESVRVV